MRRTPKSIFRTLLVVTGLFLFGVLCFKLVQGDAGTGVARGGQRFSTTGRLMGVSPVVNTKSIAGQMLSGKSQAFQALAPSVGAARPPVSVQPAASVGAAASPTQSVSTIRQPPPAAYTARPAPAAAVLPVVPPRQSPQPEERNQPVEAPGVPALQSITQLLF